MRCSGLRHVLTATALLAAAAGASADVARVKRPDARAAAGNDAAVLATDAAALVGWYHGTISNGQDAQPAGTRFALEPDGTLRGSYFLIVDGVPEPGQLDRCRVQPGASIACTWHDRFGDGPFAAQFAPGGRSFTGKWNDAGVEPSIDWLGTRIECGAAEQALALADVPPTADGHAEVCTLD